MRSVRSWGQRSDAATILATFQEHATSRQRPSPALAQQTLLQLNVTSLQLPALSISTETTAKPSAGPGILVTDTTPAMNPGPRFAATAGQIRIMTARIGISPEPEMIQSVLPGIIASMVGLASTRDAAAPLVSTWRTNFYNLCFFEINTYPYDCIAVYTCILLLCIFGIQLISNCAYYRYLNMI